MANTAYRSETRLLLLLVAQRGGVVSITFKEGTELRVLLADGFLVESFSTLTRDQP